MLVADCLGERDSPPAQDGHMTIEGQNATDLAAAQPLAHSRDPAHLASRHRPHEERGLRSTGGDADRDT